MTELFLLNVPWLSCSCAANLTWFSSHSHLCLWSKAVRTFVDRSSFEHWNLLFICTLSNVSASGPGSSLCQKLWVTSTGSLTRWKTSWGGSPQSSTEWRLSWTSSGRADWLCPGNPCGGFRPGLVWGLHSGPRWGLPTGGLLQGQCWSERGGEDPGLLRPAGQGFFFKQEFVYIFFRWWDWPVVFYWVWCDVIASRLRDGVENLS